MDDGELERDAGVSGTFALGLTFAFGVDVAAAFAFWYS